MPDGAVPTYEAFFREVEPVLRRVAYLYTGDAESAHDLVQETLVRAWERWPRLTRHPHPDAWCLTVLRNLATSRWRRARLEQRHREVVAEAACAEGPGVGHLDVVAALRRLPSEQAHALVLHDVVGYPTEEVAAAMGVPSGTVRAWLSRGRRALAEQLDDRSTQPAGEATP